MSNKNQAVPMLVNPAPKKTNSIKIRTIIKFELNIKPKKPVTKILKLKVNQIVADKGSAAMLVKFP